MFANFSIYWSLALTLLFPSCLCSIKDVTRRRIISELRDIDQQGLGLDVPFNATNDECGVRLHPIKGLLEWHFSFTGVKDSAFESGVYHGRILLHPEYPRKAPSICVFTPNGRWEVGKDICLSATSYHQETWDPNWNLRTLVMALRGHMVTYPREIGGILSTVDVHKKLASKSQDFECLHCRVKHRALLRRVSANAEAKIIDSHDSETAFVSMMRRRQDPNDLTETSSKRQVDFHHNLLQGVITPSASSPTSDVTSTPSASTGTNDALHESTVKASPRMDLLPVDKKRQRLLQARVIRQLKQRQSRLRMLRRVMTFAIPALVLFLQRFLFWVLDNCLTRADAAMMR